ncbi:MAG: threonine aldolase [Aureispira sp.]|nr:threonine aldolase [Aureispira sp.]
MKIDFRSDTVTLPTSAMKEAMLNAIVGDDVYGEDITVSELEQKTAEQFGHEAGLFCPSGTMTNQIAIKVHTNPPGQVICHYLSHVYQYEVGGIAFNSGLSVSLIHGNRGMLSAEDVRKRVNDRMDVHKPLTQLVCLENTSNKGGGCCYDLETIAEIRKVCDEHDLGLHLDGARVFNSLVAKGYTAKELGQYFDSISVCFSKGLGAPVGSVLVGSKEFIHKAKWIRKLFGGGMRQAGYLAAAGVYALEHHVERLAEDHRRAKILAEALEKQAYVKSILPVETNIIIFELADTVDNKLFSERLYEKGIVANPYESTAIRFVVHLDIDDAKLAKAIEILEGLSFD